MHSIAMLDIILGILILIFVVRCALRGFLAEFLSMTSVIFGIIGAISFYKRGSGFIRTLVFQDVPILPEILAFTALFCIIFMAIKVLESLLKDIMERIDLGGVDRFIGVLWGFIEGLVCVILVLFVLNIQPVVEKESILEGSVFAQLFIPVIEEHIPGNLNFSQE
jgi:membrane protein required for colicin V production